MENTILQAKNPHRILLGPGPGMVDPRILNVLSEPPVGHLDPGLLKVMSEIQIMLRFVFETKNEYTLAVPGTGSAAIETAILNGIQPGDPVLIGAIGFFGNRMAEMARIYGADLTVLQKPWGQVIHPDEIASALQKKPARIVGIVQAETSTGVLQPVKEIADIVHQQGGLLIVDSVTSLGGVPVRVDENGIDICYSCSQKCLGCPSGFSPITFGPQAMQVVAGRTQPVTGWYLDIQRLMKYWGPEHMYHHTASSTLVYALHEGLRIIQEQGLSERIDLHLQNAKLLWNGLEEIGLSLFVPEQYRLPSLTTVEIPVGVDDLSIRKQLLEKYNIEISGGLGELKGRIWRIGLMGYSSRMENIDLLLDALKALLNR
jgi:alanine-glyoxylate transaminase / serine-glyoxylate transaminase / serine-pyruvate transaminase